MILTTNTCYDWKSLELVGWTDGDGSGHEGYAMEYYFDGEKYLGPDEHGIEPVFAPYPV